MTIKKVFHSRGDYGMYQNMRNISDYSDNTLQSKLSEALAAAMIGGGFLLMHFIPGLIG